MSVPTLSGHGVVVRELTLHDAPFLAALATPKVVQFLTDSLRTPEDMAKSVSDALAEKTTEAFVIESGGDVVGSSRLLRIDSANRNAEIGYTFYAEHVWRTHVNTATKLLLLSHAFETHQFLRVAFQTDVANLRSRAAIERLGAREEGVFRNNRIRWDGRLRDAVFYSILAEEWPEVKARLEVRLLWEQMRTG